MELSTYVIHVITVVQDYRQKYPGHSREILRKFIVKVTLFCFSSSFSNISYLHISVLILSLTSFNT